ncbi:hypothetical protein FRB99_003728 [Tulasnella sp. 403]|nr:hypothetical protein FRB99_003728 [Tulasnella sp. 403]
MLSLLYPHVGRWRSLSVEVWEAPAADALMRALVDPAPKLQSLSLAGFGHGPFNPFGGKTPSLKNLSAKSMPMLWDSPLFSTIESLYIHCPSWSSQSILGKWRKLQKLTIRSDAIQPLVFNFPIAHVDLPDLECLELNGVTEEDIVRLLSHVEMPNLSRLLFTHIKDSPNQVSTTIFPLSNVRYLRLHATEMCQDNLLNVLRKVRNLEHISFEDSSPIPTFIHELTPNPKDASSWIIPNVTMFKVIAFEKDNAHRMYDDTDIAEALQKMIHQRAQVTPMTVRMCIFEGERDDVTRHAAEWDRERPYKSERQYTLDSRW